MAKRIVKILLGLALIPFCLGFTWQLVVMVFSTRFRLDAPYFFLAGGLTYLTIHLFFRKPIFTYVVGHELTHAFFAMLFGGSVKSFHASDRGGRVTITKSNFIITLAPYFFPLYTFIALILYWTARAADAHTSVTDILVVLSGATFAFHLILTFIFLQTDQNDIKEQGAVFSYPLIYLFNVVFAGFLMNVYLSENTDYLRFFVGGIMKSIDLIYSVFRKAAALFF
jgi:hypothetical protein